MKEIQGWSNVVMRKKITKKIIRKIYDFKITWNNGDVYLVNAFSLTDLVNYMKMEFKHLPIKPLKIEWVKDKTTKEGFENPKGDSNN
jgi:hypothetical protein